MSDQPQSPSSSSTPAAATNLLPPAPDWEEKYYTILSKSKAFAQATMTTRKNLESEVAQVRNDLQNERNIVETVKEKTRKFVMEQKTKREGLDADIENLKTAAEQNLIAFTLKDTKLLAIEETLKARDTQLTKLNNKLEENELSKETLQLTISSLSDQLLGSSDVNKVKDGEVKLLQDEVQASKDNNVVLENENKSLKMKAIEPSVLEALKSELASKDEALTFMNEDSSRLSLQIADLESTLTNEKASSATQLSALQSKSEDEIKSLQAKITDPSELEELKNELATKTNDLVEYSEGLKVMKDDSSRLSSQISALESSLKKEKDSSASFATRLLTLNSKLRTSEDETYTLKSELSSALASKKVIEDTLGRSESPRHDNTELKDKIERMKGVIQGLKADKSDLQTQVDESKENSNAMEALKIEKVSLESQLQEAADLASKAVMENGSESEIDKGEDGTLALKLDLQMMNSLMTGLKGEKSDIAEELHTAKSQLDISQAEVTKLTSRALQTVGTVKTVKSSEGFLRKEVEVKASEVLMLKGMVEGFQGEKKELELKFAKEIKVKGVEIEGLKKAVDRSEVVIGEMKAAKADIESTDDETAKHILDLKSLEISDLKYQFSKKDAEIEEMKKVKEINETTIEEMKEEARIKLETTDNKASAKASESTSLELSIADLTKTNTAKDAEIDEMKREKEKDTDEVESLKLSVKSKATTIDEIKARNAAAISKKDAELDEMKAAKIKVEFEEDEAAKKTSDLEALEIAKLKDQVLKKDAEIDEMRKEKEKGVDAVEALKIQLDKSNIEIDEMKAAKTTTDSSNSEKATSKALKDQADKMNSEIDAMKAVKAAADSTDSEAATSALNSSLEISDLKNRISEKEVELQELNAKVAEARSISDEEIKTLQTQIAAQSATSSESSERVIATLNEVESLKIKNADSNQLLSDVSSKIASLESSNLELTKSNSALETDKDNLQALMTKSSEELTAKLKGLQIQCAEYQSSIKDKSAQLVTIQKESSKKDSSISKLEKGNKDMLVKNVGLGDKVAQLEKLKKEYLDKVGKLTTENKDLASSTATAAKKTLTEHSGQTKAINENLTTANDSLTRANAEMEVLKNSTKVAVREASNLKEELTMKAEMLRTSQQQISETLDAQEKEISERERMEGEMIKAVEDRDKALIVTAEAQKSLKAKTTELSTLKADQEDLRSRDSLNVSRVNEAVKREQIKVKEVEALHTKLSMLDSHGTGLNQSINALQIKLDQSDIDVKDLESKLEVSAVELSGERRGVDNMKKQMKNYVDKLTSESEGYKEERDQLNRKLADLSGYMQRVKDLNAELDAERSKSSQLVNKVRELEERESKAVTDLEDKSGEAALHKNKRMTAKNEMMGLLRTLDMERDKVRRIEDGCNTLYVRAISQQKEIESSIMTLNSDISRLGRKVGSANVEAQAARAAASGGGDSNSSVGSGLELTPVAVRSRGSEVSSTLNSLENELDKIASGLRLLSGSVERLNGIVDLATSGSGASCIDSIVNMVMGAVDAVGGERKTKRKNNNGYGRVLEESDSLEEGGG